MALVEGLVALSDSASARLATTGAGAASAASTLRACVVSTEDRSTVGSTVIALPGVICKGASLVSAPSKAPLALWLS